MGMMRDQEPSLQLKSHLLDRIDLLEEGNRIDDHPVSDHTGRVGVENSGWHQVEHNGLVIPRNGMTGIGPALIAGNDIGFSTEEICDLPLSFVTPLGSDNDAYGHADEGRRQE
jgi:hypothetical protein